MSEDSGLADVVSRIIEMRYRQVRISPAWVATEAMQLIDPARTAPALAYIGCHLQLRQIARAQLRGRFDPQWQEEAEQHPLFPELQVRYPVKANEPEYVLLEFLTDADLAFNIARLRKDARARLSHADALEAWRISRKRRA